MKIIKEISNTGLSYIDEHQVVSFIDFSECNKNWLDYKKRKESLDDDQINHLRKTDKTIGQRDICAQPPFFEFFTKPFTRFEFADSKTKKSFEQLREKIRVTGWQTIDLS